MNRQINPFYAVIIITVIGASCTMLLVKKIYAMSTTADLAYVELGK